MDFKQLAVLLEAAGRITTLSTVDEAGAPNAAVFGSVHLLGENTLALAMGENRSLHNLRSNPRAVLLVALPGPQVLSWRGARVYLELAGTATSGPLLEGMVKQVAEQAGSMAARMIRCAVTFRITAMRPLIDFPGAGPGG
ncbi:hypothetical protein DESUT3_02820 [Desulfuromonas versatilis]|uniref:Pyridoxamine 5'-phosphate oxidase N-terminal domain-containing protein n=1 Tax=Desulfuromonas versatilis TaxID=2802975 RepID=A0ABM8HNS8_9BACT|nr:pyridoxamine 5'-phosphate oxidase family protein [Desulfuromonas versatilis]BCR03213.1 hypothetical protein DESUT3_02820 [Desulfuromonas versatilis]